MFAVAVIVAVTLFLFAAAAGYQRGKPPMLIPLALWGGVLFFALYFWWESHSHPALSENTFRFTYSVWLFFSVLGFLIGFLISQFPEKVKK